MRAPALLCLPTCAPRRHGMPSSAEKGALMRLGLCLVCLVLYGHMGWGPPDLFHPKLTLLSSGLLGFPEQGIIRSKIPRWAPGTSYHFKQENPRPLSHPVKGQFHLSLGLGFILKGQRCALFSFFHHFGEDISRGFPGPLRS